MSSLYVVMASVGEWPVDRQELLIAVCDDEAHACVLAAATDTNGAGGWAGADTWVTVWRSPPLNAAGDGDEVDWQGLG